ncbi:MAG: Nif3-like dinuclear metal center hexameric protein [Lachnospiraceae bacterium]|nr:Nif3-like dinuclear metal center hexameric protein [Lachnospiraceae bacterium]MDD3659851.1 Nif3-like dinuclear metal center hexameric protein [Lachnospiraceae bacterium]
MNCIDIIEKLEMLSPITFAEEWDNVGLLCGKREKEVTTVAVTLDMTEKAVDQAIQSGADLIISHHPMIFRSLKKINSDTATGRKLLRLIGQDISYYAMHTNFDVMGMADAVADEFGLLNSEVLSVTFEDDIAKEGIGRIGMVSKTMTLEGCAQHTKNVFGMEHVRVYGEADKLIHKAAISPGSGGDMIKDAIRKGADVLITGDIKHHEALDALEEGICIIDAGHYGTEKLFSMYIKEYLEREIPELSVIILRENNPFWII